MAVKDRGWGPRALVRPSRSLRSIAKTWKVYCPRKKYDNSVTLKKDGLMRPSRSSRPGRSTAPRKNHDNSVTSKKDWLVLGDSSQSDITL